MNNELLYLRQMLSTDYVPVVVLGGLFVALLFRRESISLPRLFRWGYIFFILSLVAPAVEQSLLAVMVGTGGTRAPLSSLGPPFAILNLAGPLCLAVGLLCILGSLMPLSYERRPALPTPPQKHPLDQ